MLALVFAARGTSFIFSKVLMNTMSPMSVLAVRFILSFLILAITFFNKLRKCDKRSLRGGLILGVMYTACMILEMYGLRLIDSGTSSLIENMAIVIVPIYIAVSTKTPPEKRTMLCAVLAVAGVGFISITQSKVSGGWLGIILTILAAVVYAACITVTHHVSQNSDPVTIGVIQIGVMGILSLFISLPSGSFSIPKSGNEWLLMLLLVLVCSCFGFAFQPLGQKYVSTETAAIFTVINPLTASIISIFFTSEHVSFTKIIGYIMIMLALVLYNIKPRHHLDPS